MFSARKAAAVWLFLTFERVLTAQTPLSSHAPLSFYQGVENDLGRWDLGEAPAVNATGHLVFETANSLLHTGQTHVIVLRCEPPRGHLGHPRSRGVVGNEPDWVNHEKQRIMDLCKWGQKYGVNGFVSEIMICNFTSHMEVVSFLNLESTRIGPPTNWPEDLNTVHHVYEVMHSASWHGNYPGETRIVLDFSGLVSFYDTALVPSLVPRRVGLERWDHRVGGISSGDIERVHDRLAQALVRPPVTTSGIDWKTVLRVVVDRYASRLELMQYLLNMTLDDRLIFDHAQQVQRRLPRPSNTNTSATGNATNSWAAPVFRECATSHTASIVAHGVTLMPSEHLLLQAVRETTREICRVVTKMWASGLIVGVDPFYPPEQFPEADHIHTLMGEWKEDVTRLISWLDWSVWVKCRPACGIEVTKGCATYLLGPLAFSPPPGGADDAPPFQDSASLWPDPNKGEWKRPQPKCIRRLEPYGF
ncbi:hypothetical protein DFJ58DRAFT_918181 [Suillus subalutaceus]|uniref:uncharacterized protein n=1 Tax=Suillus subalutaceus TaxID=48586 RepID=UPI001B86D855|nr:uncharacterized protein DFJ58DRAFT_918181 [Suillus subalutaceus]KAG1832308.1 hypothetical protein DFJ58DRAFT_918181 [Suillus subalutaceus]